MHEQIMKALRQVIDPELKINIVDLGLVYSADMRNGNASVAMTLTTPGCPLAGHIVEAAEAAIWQHVTGVESVEIKLVWSPPWRLAMMSEEAQDQLGWM